MAFGRDRPTLFDGLTAEERLACIGALPIVTFEPGETLLVQGSRPSRMFILESGAAEVSISSPRRQAVLGQLGPGDTCGELSLLTGQPVSATVTASASSSAFALGADGFNDLVSTHPIVYRNVGRLIAERLWNADLRRPPSTPGRPFKVVDESGSPLSAFALACSIAWHRRQATLLLIPDGAGYARLTDLPGAMLADPIRATGANRRRANVVTHRGSVDTMLSDEHRLNDLGFNTLLVLDKDDPGSGPGAPTIVLPRLPEPDSRGHAQLTSGVVSLDTTLGRLAGAIARRLCGLQVGIALGEGSAKGFAHFGVLRRLERAGVPIDAIAGTSIGGVVAGLYASEASVDEAQRQLARVGSATFRPSLRPRASLMSHGAVERIMREVWGDTCLEELSIPLAIVAADIVSGNEVVFKRGLLWAAALAGISIPGIYPAQRMGELVLVDGGVVDPVPTEVVRELGADIVIAVRLATRRAAPTRDARALAPSGRVPSVVQTALRSRDLMQGRDHSSAANATVVIEPRFSLDTGLGLRDFSRGQRFVEAGELATEAVISRVETLLPWLGPQPSSD